MKTSTSLIMLSLILFLGLFMRGWQYKERFMYNHDNDLSSWMVRDVVVNHHLRLIGQQTSEPGIFIGPLFYYSLIPFYLASGMDPLSGVFLSLMIGALAVASVYYVFSRLYGSAAGIFASLFYAVSFSIALNERDVVPTTPVMLWSIWFYYSINLLFRGKKPLVLIAVLFALVWNLNLALVLLAPLVFLGIITHYKSYKISDFLKPALVFLVISLPLLVFEFRHNFIQSRALATSLIRVEHKTGSPIDKVGHVLQYAAKNSTHLISWDWPYSYYLLPVALLVILLFLVWKRFIPRSTLAIYLSWIVLYCLFFAAHPINLSEYYLNGMNILTVAGVALTLAYLYSITPVSKIVSILIILSLVYYNVASLLSSHLNQSGYLERTALVDYIKQDALHHNYPCVAVSYITNPGYNLGYRYLFWRSGLKVNNPSRGSPVYTIVFPHPLVNHLDKTIGALGLIYPDYSRYSPAQVRDSCAGPDDNTTGPLFGYTE